MNTNNYRKTAIEEEADVLEALRAEILNPLWEYIKQRVHGNKTADAIAAILARQLGITLPPTENPEHFLIDRLMAIIDYGKDDLKKLSEKEMYPEDIKERFKKFGEFLNNLENYLANKSGDWMSIEEKAIRTFSNMMNNCCYRGHLKLGKKSNCRKEQYALVGIISALRNTIENGDPLEHLTKAGETYLEICKKCPYE